MHSQTDRPGQPGVVDAVVVGAGFAGLYMLHRLLRLGFSVQGVEAGPDVGGTWYWNRYPGARCDVESLDYSYSFDEALQQDWTWTERYPAQPEILRYLRHVANRFGLRRHICFGTRVRAANYDDTTTTWTVRTDDGRAFIGRSCVMATGCLSVPKEPDLPGIEDFTAEIHHTARWPEEEVDFAGKRVGVIGTGSSGVQIAPVIARRAAQLTVFQRTAAFSVPAMNEPLTQVMQRAVKAEYTERRRLNRASQVGVARDDNPQSALRADAVEREREYESRWKRGGFALLGAYGDLLLDQRANDTVADFVRRKIRTTVTDPSVAQRLLPWEYPLGTKRICLDSGYYEMFNRDNVTLVDLRTAPLTGFTATGVRTRLTHHTLDCLVLATGFDAMTGALARIDIRGRDDVTLADKWRNGPRTYLGLATARFPNLWFVTGPGSPSVLTNMVTSIEQHVEWISDCMAHMRTHGHRTVEPLETAENQWTDHVEATARATLFARTDSWYSGANVPSKPRVFTPYAGGFATYAARCREITDEGYKGFVFSSAPVSHDADRRR